ncbi:uncharacterized protein [Eurosta solidaginis]|uniref:uncharacterized protein n=1 Tax=Eurosta solidaginis TaxID=178769 RepID=UPI0035313DFB
MKEAEAEQFKQSALHNIVLVREEVNEVERAYQLAKRGIINTNLLDMDEVNQILSEIETLPYQNIIEAIEYGKPSIYTNGTMLLYVLSIPKVTEKKYNLLITRAGIYEGKQLDLPFDKMLVNQEETYGLKENCLTISSSTVCESESLSKLEENTCLPWLLNGGDASCQFIRRNGTIIELINDNTIFISNYQGVVESNNNTSNINGTYVIQLSNETIKIGNQVFSSNEAITAQALPAVLANVKNHTTKINLEYVHDITMENVRYLGYVNGKTNFSLVTEAASIFAIALIVTMLWKWYTRKLDIPPVQIPMQWATKTKIFKGHSAHEIRNLDDSAPVKPVRINITPSNQIDSIKDISTSHFSCFDLRDADL